MPYLWTNQEIIQSYLDGEGSIQIQDEGESIDVVKNFARSTAMRLENESVFEIATLLSMAFQPDTSDADSSVTTEIDRSVLGETPLGFKPVGDTTTAGTFCPTYLSLLAAKLAASKIATTRLGESLSSLPNWIRAYKNEVYAQIQRWVLNAETASITGLEVRADFDVAEVLMKMKTREHSAEELQD